MWRHFTPTQPHWTFYGLRKTWGGLYQSESHLSCGRHPYLSLERSCKTMRATEAWKKPARLGWAPCKYILPSRWARMTIFHRDNSVCVWCVCVLWLYFAKKIQKFASTASEMYLLSMNVPALLRHVSNTVLDALLLNKLFCCALGKCCSLSLPHSEGPHIYQC